MSKDDEHILKVQQLFVRHQGQLKAFVKAIRCHFSGIEHSGYSCP